MIDAITGPLGAMGAVAVAALFWVLDRWNQRRKGRNEGKQEAETKAKVRDHETAADIRRRARDADGVQPDDALRYRD